MSTTEGERRIGLTRGLEVREEPKRSPAHLCMCYYYLSLHNNLEICTKRLKLNKLGN